MSAMASQITSLTIVYSTLYLGADQRKHQSSASLAFVRGIHPSLVNSPHKRPVTRKMFPFDDIIMVTQEDPLTWNKANLRDLITATGQAISLKLDSNHWFFCPYAHEIWWSQKTIGHLFCATSSFVHDFKAIGDFNLELLSGNTQFGSKLAIFACVTLKFDEKPWKTLGHLFYTTLTHWGQVTHICVVKLTITASDNGLSPERHQAIIWTNAGILLIGPLGTNVSEILIAIQTFSLKKIRLKMSSAKCCSFRPGLNELSLMTWVTCSTCST